MSIYNQTQSNIMPGLQGMQGLSPDLSEFINLGMPREPMRQLGGSSVVDLGTRYPGQSGSGGGGPAGGSWFSRQSMFGGMDQQTGMQMNGWAPTALTAASSLMGGYLGLKQYGLAKKQLGESKRQFNKNFEAQRSSVNTRLEDRQKARVASNPDAYQSVGDYMKKHGV